MMFSYHFHIACYLLHILETTMYIIYAYNITAKVYSLMWFLGLSMTLSSWELHSSLLQGRKILCSSR